MMANQNPPRFKELKHLKQQTTQLHRTQHDVVIHLCGRQYSYRYSSCCEMGLKCECDLLRVIFDGTEND